MHSNPDSKTVTVLDSQSQADYMTLDRIEQKILALIKVKASYSRVVLTKLTRAFLIESCAFLNFYTDLYRKNYFAHRVTDVNDEIYVLSLSHTISSV